MASLFFLSPFSFLDYCHPNYGITHLPHKRNRQVDGRLLSALYWCKLQLFLCFYREIVSFVLSFPYLKLQHSKITVKIFGKFFRKLHQKPEEWIDFNLTTILSFLCVSTCTPLVSFRYFPENQQIKDEYEVMHLRLRSLFKWVIERNEKDHAATPSI